MIYPSVPLIKEETYAKTGEPSAKRPLLRQGADTPLGTVPRGLGLGRSKSTDAVNRVVDRVVDRVVAVVAQLDLASRIT